MDNTIRDAHLDEKESVSLTNDEMEQVNGGITIGPSWMLYRCPKCGYNDFDVKVGVPPHATIKCNSCNTIINF